MKEKNYDYENFTNRLYTGTNTRRFAGAGKIKSRSDGNKNYVGVLRWNNHTRKRTPVSGNRRIDMQEYFEFLEDLRDSGSMNMMGAPRELEYAFGLDRAEAREVFSKWCESLRES
tara:strand:+ start:289 stop:633 length:345 start_codon:yes stop_codon:yes gene_type:complete